MIHIVDDNETVLDVMIELVQAFGFRAQPFSSARSYLEYVSSPSYKPPGAVFSDVMMPDLDGFELMQRVRARHPEVRFVMMSGEDHTTHSDKEGACAYLLKPIRFDKLENTFRHLRLCISCGASRAQADKIEDDRRHFGLTSHHCPFLTGLQD